MIYSNILVLLIATLSTFVVAGIWYSPLVFGKAWHRESRDRIPFKPTHPFKTVWKGLVLSTVVTVTFSFILGPHPTIPEGMFLGLRIGVCFVAASFGLHYQFVDLSLKLLCIDGGFRVVQFIVFGFLLGWLS